MYKGYVIKNEFIEFFGKEIYSEVLKTIFNKYQITQNWNWEEFSKYLEKGVVYPSDQIWCLSELDSCVSLDGWLEQSAVKDYYYKVTPEEFIKNTLGENYMQVDHKIANTDNSIENLTLVKAECQVKPRYHHKRKPVPTRKKTDVTVYYSTGEKYTLKNIRGLNVQNGVIILATDALKKDGFNHSQSYGFTVSNVDSFLVKTPQGKYTLDHVGNGHFIMTENQTVITLTSINQIF